MRILGIDPGLKLTGYGVVDWHPLKPKLVDGGVIRLDAKVGVAQRLVELERVHLLRSLHLAEHAKVVAPV